MNEHEELLRTLINTTPDIICFKDGKGRWLEANRADLELFSLQNVDYRGKTDAELAELVNPVYRAAFLTCARTDEAAWRKGTISRGEETIRKPDGTVKVYDVIKVPLFEEDGSRKGLVVLGRDITDRKKLEEVLRETLEFQKIVLHIATEFINVPAENFDEYIDRSLATVGSFLKVDRAYLFRYDFSERITFNTHEWCAEGITPQIDKLQAVPMDMFPEWVGAHEKGEPIVIPSVSSLPEGELKRILQAQDILSLITVPLFLDGECWGFVGFDSVRREKEWSEGEISVLKVLAKMYINVEKFRRSEGEKAMLQAQLQQSQKMESLGRLAGGVAHDINNLLTPILGFAEKLAREFDENSPYKMPSEMIVSAANRAKDIVRRLLAFSRSRLVEEKLIDVNEVLSGLKNLLERTIRENVTVDFVLTPFLPLIFADVGQLEQALVNLAVNAQDAMPDGGVLTFETAVADLDDHNVLELQGLEPGRYVTVAVSDTGCGMDAETRKRIFDPFFTTKDKQEGTGLGLSIVYGIVKRHGGHIQVSSELGKGTTFRMFFPVSDETGGAEKDDSKTVSDNLFPGKETILVAEDNDLVRKLLVYTLEDLGYTVFQAACAEEAIEVIERGGKKIDLLLTDVVMPGMNGNALFYALIERIPGLKVIYMSGYEEEIISRRGVHAAEMPFLQKPFGVEELTAKVREVLDGR